MRRFRSWFHCSICRCWFGTHDHAVLHGDGTTDDTFALQARIAEVARAGGGYVGSVDDVYRVSGATNVSPPPKTPKDASA